MGAIEAIIFDKDGTLFDFQATWSAWAEDFLAEVAPGASRAPAARALGYDPASRRFLPESVAVSATTRAVAEAVAPVLGVTAERLVAVSDRIAAATRQRPASGLDEVLAGLAARYPLGLVTNDSETPARAHLAGAGILGHFAFVAGYDSGHGAKPDPGPLLAFSRATGTRPAATLMVGDSRHDLEAGRRAGMIPVGVLTGVAAAQDLADLAQAILPDIGHLPDWIRTRDARP